MYVDNNEKNDYLWGGYQEEEHRFFGQASLRVANRTNIVLGGVGCWTQQVSDRVKILIYPYYSDEEDTPWMTEQPHRPLEVPRKMPVAIVGSKEDLCRNL